LFATQALLSDASSFRKLRQLLSSWYQTITLEYLPVFPWLAEDDHFLISWRTGAAVLLILHYSNPSCVDLHCVQEAYATDSSLTMSNNIDTALETAFSEFGVEKRLSAQNIMATRTLDDLACIIYLCDLCIATIPHADSFREIRQKHIYNERQLGTQNSSEAEGLHQLPDMAASLYPNGNNGSSIAQKLTIDELEDIAYNIRHMVSMLRVKLDDCVPRRSITFRRDDGSLNLMRDRSATPSTFSEASVASTSMEDDDTTSLHSTRTVHPLQAMDDDNYGYEMTLENTIEAAQRYKNHDIQSFYAAAQYLQCPSSDFNERVIVLLESIKELDHSLAQDMVDAREAYLRFDRGYGFSKQAKSVRSELDFIQAKMVKTTTTNTGITELEDRAKHAFMAIIQLGDEFSDLLSSDFSDQSYRNNLDALVQKYELVQAWVEEVRIWFAEAERIREWIESRIGIIEDNEISDPLDEQIHMTQAEVEELNTEHEALEQEIELFNKEDMTRLRSHVKALTGSERRDKDLSPADTTTIEITLTTLMTLDRLMHLLRQKTYTLQILTMRVLWEDELAEATSWVKTGEEQTTEFLRTEARWRVEFDMCETLVDGCLEHEPRTNHMDLRSAVINRLLALERGIAEFDQGQFTNTLNSFQDLEDAAGLEMPQHLEARETRLEISFETLAGRVSFARKVIEQRLTVMEYVQQYIFVKNEGKSLSQDLDNMCANAAPNMYDGEIGQRAQMFQTNVSRLSGPVTKHITYPQHSTIEDEADNDESNHEIQMYVEARNSELDDMTSSIHDRLNTLRRLIAEHNEASDILFELEALKTSVSKLLKDAEKSSVDINAVDLHANEADVKRLKNINNEALVHSKALNSNNFDSLRARLDTLANQVDPEQCSIDFLLMSTKISDLESTFDEYMTFLAHQDLLLEALDHRLRWESSYEHSSNQIMDANSKLWESTKITRWRPVEMLALLVELAKSDHGLTAQGLKNSHNTLTSTLKELESNSIATTRSLFSAFLVCYTFVQKEIGSDIHQTFMNLIQRRQNTLQSKFDDLTAVFSFNHDLLDQRTTICDLLDDISELENNGRTWLEQIQQMTASSCSQQIQIDFGAQIDQFVKGIVALYPKRVSDIPFIRQPTLQHLPALSNEDDDVLDQAIRGLLERRECDLRAMADDLKAAQERYKITLEFKAQVSEYELCAADLCSWMLKHSQDLADCRLELKSVLKPLHQKRLDSVIQLQDERYHQVDNIARKRLDLLATKVAELEDAIIKKEASEVDITPATSAYDLAVADMAILIHAMEGHGRDINARKQHLLLQQVLSSSQQEAKSYQDQINQLSIELDRLTDHDLSSEIQQQDVANVMSRCNNVDNELLDFDSRIGSEIRAGLSELERLCSQLLEPEGPPVDLTRRILDLDDCYIKLRESTSVLRTRIERLIHCLECLHTAADIFSWYDDYENDIRAFVKDKARWKPDINPAHVEIQKLAEEIDNIKVNLDICESQRIEPCLANLNEIKRCFSDSKFVNMVKRLESAQCHLETGVQRLHEHVAFVDTVIAQNRSASWYLVKIADMQHQAEGIKADLITHNIDSTSRLDEMSVLEAQMLATQQESNMRISYSVRSFAGHNEEDVQQDNNANSMLQETVKARNTQLQQSLATIKSIVQSNEKMCQRRAAVQQYHDQANSLKSWLATVFAVLERVTSSGNASSLEDNLTNLTKIQAIDTTFKAYQPTYDDLKQTAVETIQYLSSQDDDHVVDEPTNSSELIVLINETQSDVDVKWEELSLAHVKARLMIKAHIDGQQLGKALQALSHECERLLTEINETNDGDVENDLIASWSEKMEHICVQQMASLQDQYIHQQIQREQQALPSSEANEGLLDQATQITEQLKLAIEQHAQKLRQRKFLDLCMASGSDITEESRKRSLTLSQFNMSSGHLTGDNKLDSEQQQSILDMINDMEAEVKLLDVKYLQYCDQLASGVVSSDLVSAQKLEIQNAIQNFKEDLSKTKTMSEKYNTALANQQAIVQVKSELLPEIESRLRVLSINLEDMTSFEEVIKNLDHVKDILQTLESHQGQPEDKQHVINKDRVQRQYVDVQNAFEQAALKLKDLKARQGQASLVMVFFTACATLQDLCKEQANLVLITMDSTAKSQFYAKDPTFIERLLRQSISIHTSAETEYKRLGAQIELQTCELERITVSGDEEKAALEGAREAWDRLRIVLNREQRQLDFLRKIFAFTKASNEIYAWMEGCKRALRNVDMASIEEYDQRSEIEDLHAKVSSFEPTMTAFNNMVVSLLKDKNEQTIDLNEINLKGEDVLATIDMRSGRVLTEWDALKKQIASIQSGAESNVQGITIARKTKEIIALVDRIKKHLSSLSLIHPSTGSSDVPLNMQELPLSQLISEREVIVVEAQMSNLEKEVEYQLNQKINDLDVILASLSTLQDGDFVTKRAEIAKVVTELANKMDQKHQEIGTALKLAGFVNAIDELEVLLTAVKEAVDPCTTQTKAGRVPSKADLQALLIELDTRFKYYGPRIREKLEETKSSVAVFENDARITEKYNEAEQQWIKLHEQATQAKAQLTSKINDMRETTSTTYLDRVSPQPSRPHSVAGVRTRKISERTASPAFSRAMTPNPRSSTSTQTSTRGLSAQVPRMRRATLTPMATPMASRSGKGTSVPPRYVPDPKSDLDVQLGKVVNESPYKIRIKMVPGEVGKYWFGEVEPRLVYCRILRSNMVMVRVGGGWTELSQFLRDHALLEGRLIPNRDEKKRPDVREAYLRTRPKDTGSQDEPTTRSLTVVESSDPVKISRSTPSRGTPAAAGVKEGNRFLMTVDGEGNRLEISMKKASDHEPRLTSAPRRSHQQ
jgi:hypothetical protein